MSSWSLGAQMPLHLRIGWPDVPVCPRQSRFWALCFMSQWISPKSLICPSFTQTLSQVSWFFASARPEAAFFTWSLMTFGHVCIKHKVAKVTEAIKKHTSLSPQCWLIDLIDIRLSYKQFYHSSWWKNVAVSQFLVWDIWSLCAVMVHIGAAWTNTGTNCN